MISWHDVWNGGWDAAKIILAALLCMTIVTLACVLLYAIVLVLGFMGVYSVKCIKSALSNLRGNKHV